MISKIAVEEYLNKQFKDWSGLKKLSDNEILSSFQFKFKTKPFHHQVVGTATGFMNNNFIYLYDMGLGKSKIILDILSSRRIEWNKMLILSPNISTVSTWADEIKKHSDFTYCELTSTIEERHEKLLSTNVDLYLLNYTGFLLMLTDNDGGSWVSNNEKIKKFQSYFDGIVWDEIHNCKNHTSLTFKLSRSISKNYKFRFGLTGTPMNRSPIDLWSVFYLIDRGETLGDTISIYREAYFDAKQNYWGGIDYKFKKQYENDLNKRIANKSIRYSSKEAIDLPPLT